MSYYGKYRAIVTNNKDPEKLNRVKVKCPSVLGNYESGWCNPCFPIVIEKVGKFQDDSGQENLSYLFRLPNIGEPIWIEFEQGDTSKPIWVGTWRCKYIE